MWLMPGPLSLVLSALMVLVLGVEVVIVCVVSSPDTIVVIVKEFTAPFIFCEQLDVGPQVN